jgi:hypothetical protein
MRQFEIPNIKAASTPALLQRGCVHVIGLEPLRDRAGRRWGKMRGAVFASLELILRQRLGPSDFFMPLDDVTYLVTMPGTESEDAQIACLRVTYELYVNFLGQCQIDTICLYRATQAEGNAIGVERIATEELLTLAQRAGISENNAKAHDEVALGQRRASEDPTAIDVEVHFLPVWDAHNEAITLYSCEPKRLSRRSTPSLALSLDELNPQCKARMEISCLQQGVAALARHLERGERFMMIFQVCYDTLSSHLGRVQFRNACRELPSHFRQYLIIQLTDAPPGVPHSRLCDLVIAVKPYVKAVMSEIPDFWRNYADYNGLGLQAVGMNFDHSRLTHQQKSDALRKLITSAKQIGLSTFLMGVSDFVTLRSAREGRIHFLSGPAIASPLEEPRPMTRLRWDEVMQSLVGKQHDGDLMRLA